MTSNDAAPETPPDDGATGLSTHGAVYGRVSGLIVNRLWKETPSARALRAQLRGALSREAGSVPELWDLTLDGRPGYLGDEPTRGEKAVHGRSRCGRCTRDRTQDPCMTARSAPEALPQPYEWSRRDNEEISAPRRRRSIGVFPLPFRPPRSRDFSCICVRLSLSSKPPRFPVTTGGLQPTSSRGRTRVVARPSCATGGVSLLVPLKLSTPTLPLTSDVEATQSNKLHV